MRFISWNVNGLRAVVKKGFEDIFGNSESIGKSVRREILAQDKA